LKDTEYRSFLNDATIFHDCDFMTDFTDDMHFMCNQYNGQTYFLVDGDQQL